MQTPNANKRRPNGTAQDRKDSIRLLLAHWITNQPLTNKHWEENSSRERRTGLRDDYAKDDRNRGF